MISLRILVISLEVVLEEEDEETPEVMIFLSILNLLSKRLFSVPTVLSNSPKIILVQHVRVPEQRNTPR